MNIEREQKLNDLIEACWAHHAWAKENYPDILPPKEIPILWFGNLKKYFESERKIVTVGLNPSMAEFQKGKRPTKTSPWSMHRFGDAAAIAQHGALRSVSDYSAYQTALANYFRGYSGKETGAYRVWFSSWNGILRALKAGFDPVGSQSTAIHIDFCTPIATNPKWGGLSSEKREAIAAHASTVGLWKEFVNFLKPHLLLTCIAGGYIPQIVESLGWNTSNCRMLRAQGCTRGPAHRTFHVFGNVDSQKVNLFAAPAGSPWRGWYKCQVEDFAKEIEKAVWEH